MEGKKEILKPSHVLGLSITIYIAGSLLGGFAAMIAASYMGNDVDTCFNLHTLIVSIIVIPVVYRLLRDGGMWQFRNGSWTECFKYAALGMLLVYVIGCASEYVFIVFDLYDHESVRELIRLNDIGNSSNVVLQILASAVAPSICEELFFRGALFGVLRLKKGFLFSAIISSLIFGAMHDLGLYMLVAFLSGMVLCLVYELTRSIIVPIMIHFCNNLLVIIAAFNEAVGSVYTFENMTMNVVMMLGLSAVVAIMSAILLKRVLAVGNQDNRREPYEKVIDPDQRKEPYHANGME